MWRGAQLARAAAALGLHGAGMGFNSVGWAQFEALHLVHSFTAI